MKRTLTLGDLRRELNGQPLAMERYARDAVLSACNSHEFRAGVMEEIAAEHEPKMLTLTQGVGTISVEGMLVKRPSIIQAIMGGVCQLSHIEDQLAQAMTQDSPLTGLILRMDSPGGTLAGIPELATKIRGLTANSPFPIVAMVEGQACSGAYWLASQCDQVCVSEASSVGSIGVITSIMDDTRQQQNEGMDMRTFATDSRKTGIGPETDRSLQAQVDKFTGVFRQAVARGRGMTEQQVAALPSTEIFTGQDAVRAGLADEVTTYEALLARYALKPKT